MLEKESMSVQEREYECLASLRDVAIIMKELFEENHRSSCVLADIVDFIDDRTKAYMADFIQE